MDNCTACKKEIPLNDIGLMFDAHLLCLNNVQKMALADMFKPPTLEAVKEYALWLSNDCGGCETCSRVFSQSDREQLPKMIAQLSPADQEAFVSQG